MRQDGHLFLFLAPYWGPGKQPEWTQITRPLSPQPIAALSGGHREVSKSSFQQVLGLSQSLLLVKHVWNIFHGRPLEGNTDRHHNHFSCLLSVQRSTSSTLSTSLSSFGHLYGNYVISLTQANKWNVDWLVERWPFGPALSSPQQTAAESASQSTCQSDKFCPHS